MHFAKVKQDKGRDEKCCLRIFSGAAVPDKSVTNPVSGPLIPCLVFIYV